VCVCVYGDSERIGKILYINEISLKQRIWAKKQNESPVSRVLR